MEPKTTAIVLIEFQNDFTTPGGTLHDAVKSVMQTSKMLENTKQTVARARELGATIAHAPITFAEGYGEITSEPYGILKGVVDSKSFIKGSWGAHIVDDLEPQPHDIVIEGKRGLDTFASTNLDFILRSRGITTIALAGFLTNCCVESTMRSAYERGYDVVTLTDCTATLSEEELPNVLSPDDARCVPRTARGQGTRGKQRSRLRKLSAAANPRTAGPGFSERSRGESDHAPPDALATVGRSSWFHSSHDPSYTATSANPAALSAKYEPAAETPLPHETIVRFPRSSRSSETRRASVSGSAIRPPLESSSNCDPDRRMAPAMSRSRCAYVVSRCVSRS